MGLRLPENMVNNMINSIYKVNGKNPSSTRKEDGIKTSEGVKKQLGDSLITSDELKRAVNNPYGRIALSLRDTNHTDRANDLADEVARGLDRADGREDGYIHLNDTSAFAAVFTNGKADVSEREMAAALASGSIVIGEGGTLLDRRDAKTHGDTIVAVHENNAGPKIALDQ